ncbi:unnamed protein product [Closterium sp. NIES-53]
MEVARTSMIHAAAPHFLWPFAVRYAAHQLNLWPRVSLPETLPKLRWTGEVGDASVFRVWGSRAFVPDTSTDKLSTRAIPCVFLGFPPDAPGWQFYHPTSRRVFPSQDVTFDESVPFYRLFPYGSAPHPPPPLFLTPGPPPVDPLLPQGPAPSGVSQVDPLPGTVPVQVLLEVLRLEVLHLGVLSLRVRSLGVLSLGVLSLRVPGLGVLSLGVLSVRVRSLGVLSLRVRSLRGPTGASPRQSPWPEPLSPQQLREWFAQRTRLWSGAARAGDSAAGDTGAGGVGATHLGGAGFTAGAGGTGRATTAGPGGACTRGTGAAGTGSVGGAGAGGPRAGDFADPGGAGVGGDGAGGTGGGGAGAGGAGAGDIGRRVPHSRPPRVPGTYAMALCPSSVPLRVPLSPPPESSLSAIPDPESDLARAARPTVSRLLATVVTDPSFESTTASALVAELVDFVAACRLDYATALVGESESASPPSVRGECALGTDVLEDRQEDFECLAAAVPHLVAMLLALEGDPDAPDLPTPRSYAKAMTGPYSSQWQTAMDAEMASWKSTGTYVDAFPPSGSNIVDGMWIFRVKRPPGSPPAFKARYVARGFSQRQGVDYFQTFSPTPKMTTLQVLLHVAAQREDEFHSLDFSTVFLQGSLHEEIWLRRPHSFTGSFPAGTQWSLRWPVYGLRQAHREWHETVKTTLAALGFTPSTADPSLFLRSDTSLPSFYVLVYVDDLVFATADTKAPTLVKSELQKRHTCTDLGELRSYPGLQITQDRARRTITLTQSYMVHQVLQHFGFQFSSPQPTPLSTGHSLSAPPSNESVEPSGPYPELVGCLMYLMTCTRPDLAYPLSLLALRSWPVGPTAASAALLCVARPVARDLQFFIPPRARGARRFSARRAPRGARRFPAVGEHAGPPPCTSRRPGEPASAPPVRRDALGSPRVPRQTSGMGLVLGRRRPVVLSGHADASWVDDLATQRSSSCEAEIYAGAMAAQELHWLTYLLNDLGEQPRAPPVLYVDNKAMIALCEEHRLEYRMKRIALRYFLARELQQRGH